MLEIENNLKSKINSPVKYFGGKGNINNLIISLFPKEGTYNHYVEPFSGSFSVGLQLNPVPIEIYNDLYNNIYSLFKVISDRELFKIFKEKCDLAIYHEQLRKDYKQYLLDKNISLIDRAFYYFYVNRSSYKGNGGFSCNTYIRRNMSKSVSDFLSTVDNLDKIHERLSRVVVRKVDGITLIKKFNKPNMLLYCDPPYIQDTRSSDIKYDIEMSDSKHRELVTEIIKSKAKIIISGYDHPIYQKLVAHGFKKKNYDVDIRDGKGNKKKSTEVLWFNYELE